MGRVIVTLEVMPESPEVDLDALYEKVVEVIKKYQGEAPQKQIQPIAFGLKKLVINFIIPETDFNEEQFIEELQSIEGVQSAEITNVTRDVFG